MTTADSSPYTIEIFNRVTGEVIETIYNPSIKDREAASYEGVRACVHDHGNNPDLFYRVLCR